VADDDHLRTVAEHLDVVLAGIGSIDTIELNLLDAQGLLLAQSVSSDVSLPGFDNAAVDGYALRAIDTRDATPEQPLVLPVVGDVVAGATTRSGMGPGLAMRIMAGAPLPAGADTVIPTEDTDGGVARVTVRRAVYTGERVRRAGEDLHAGSPALPAGAALGPQQLALLAAIGRDRVTVRPRPRILVVSTGNELVEVGHLPGFGEVTDSNSYLIAAAAKDAGADARRVGIVPDDHGVLLDVLENQLLRADLIVTTGGAGHGAFDMVRQALSELGTVEFAQVAMDPGNQQGFGHVGDRVPIFCLPGDPVSALVSFEAFVRPAIRKLLGKRNLHRASVQAVALEGGPSPLGLRQYRRGVLYREANGGYSVSFVSGSGSHLIASTAAANCLVVVDEEVTDVEPGARLTVVPLLLSNR
jgi:molybdopterin molybdotransferase